MIDSKFGLSRFLAEYSEQSEELIARYEFAKFDLDAFQSEFQVESSDPMFDCYEVGQRHLRFLESCLARVPSWDFDDNSYFLESHTV
ncbi:DUF7683 domain-containing protein [Marinobacter mangrovi]